MKLPFGSANDSIGLPIWAMGTDQPVRVLLIDDDDEEATLTRSMLNRVDDVRYELDWVSTFSEGLASIALNDHDAYLIDHQLGGQTGTDLVREAREAGSLAALIMMTGQRHRATDVAAMNAGATDFLMKGRIDAALLDRTLRYAISQATAMEALDRSRSQMAGLEQLAQILGDDGPTPSAMARIVDLIGERFMLSRVAIYLADGEVLQLAAQRGYSHPVQRLSRADSSVERVARARQPVFVPSLGHDQEDGAGSDVATELSVPLLVAGELAGLLNVASMVATPIGEGDFAAVRLVADRLTTALSGVRERAMAADQLRKARQQLAVPQAFTDSETSTFCRPLLEPLLDVAIASVGSKASRNPGLLLVACEDVGGGAVTRLAMQARAVFANRARVRFGKSEIAILMVAASGEAARTEARDLVAVARNAGLDVWCGYAAWTAGTDAAALIVAAEASLAFARRREPGTIIG
ncbi:MAG: two-component system, sensor histidine kinase and response regulator [Chloroflexota bacterium]|nr:two-component system, sensor histidine kinase and response regulator [Chloroflexota bacterium]MEA2653382.1 two-component system, sensor histidine kinase and response regulator [Chloroflexota bacterium]